MDALNQQPPDDLAWTPARPGGAAFGTHRLVASPQRLEFRPSTGSKLLIGVIACIGVGTMIGGLIVQQRTDDMGALVVGVVMLVPTLVLVAILGRMLINRRVFDRELGLYWDTRGGERMPLREVRGVQIVRERVVGPESDHDADELNLVLTDGRRINVVDHGDAARLHEDARRVAEWLQVPLWSRARD